MEISVPDISKYKCQQCQISTQNYDPTLFPFSEVKEFDNLNNSANIKPDEKIEDINIWQPFQKKGLHMIHLNINSLLNKIHELRFIAQKSNPTIIGITESKLDDTVLNSEVSIEGYTLFRSDRTRNGGGVIMYVNNCVGVKERKNFSKDIENVFVDILLPKTKPILVGTIYNPFQPNFLQNLTTAISNAETFDNQDVYILGDFNINLWHKDKYIFHNNKTLSHQDIQKIAPSNASDIIKYQEFCSLHGLKQLISTPTRITENKSSLLDHILTNTHESILQSGKIEVGLSDHQLIFITRKKYILKTRDIETLTSGL